MKAEEEYGPTLLRFAYAALVRRRRSLELSDCEFARRSGLSLALIETFEADPDSADLPTLQGYASGVGVHIYISLHQWELPQETVSQLRDMRQASIANGPHSNEAKLFRGFVNALVGAEWPHETIVRELSVTTKTVGHWMRGTIMTSPDWRIPRRPESPRPMITKERPLPTPYEVRRMLCLHPLAAQLRDHPPGAPVPVGGRGVVAAPG